MNWSENKTKFYFFIIIILIIVILLQKCGGGSGGTKFTNHNDTIRTVDTVYITITKEIPTYVPKWHNKTKYIYDTTKKM